MASVGGSLTWEAEDLEGELCLGAGVGAAGQDESDISTGRESHRKEKKGCSLRKELLRELVDGVVEVTGVRFI